MNNSANILNADFNISIPNAVSVGNRFIWKMLDVDSS